MILNPINKLLSVLIVWSLATIAFAASFELIVSDQQIASDQSLSLNFRLADAKLKSEPDFSALTNDFDIYSQGTSSSYSLMNSNLSQSTTWTLVVMPKRVGKIIVPKVSVGTSKGTLTSQEVSIDVVQHRTNNNPNLSQSPTTAYRQKSKNIYLEGSFQAQEIYINQPFIYIMKIISKIPVANMSLSDLHSEDAIIERYGEPIQYNTLTSGEQTAVTEIKYIVTPLKAGKMVLNPASVKYEVLNSFFSRNPIAPGTAYSDEELLKVLDIPEKLQPFSKLTIDDTWDLSDNKPIHENDSLTRTIKIIGEDGYVDALKIDIPEQTSQYNLYQDKSKETRSVSKNDRLHSEKVINYTIIPIKAGELVIPKTTVRWWNIKKKQIELLEIPEKRMNVLAISGTKVPEIAEESIDKEIIVNNDFKYKNWLIASVLLNLGFILFHLFKWSLKFKKPKPQINLDEVETVDELKSYINYFVQDNWKIKGNLPLKDLWLELAKANFSYDQHLAKELTSKLNSNLYFKEELQVAKALDLWRKFSVTVAKKNTTKEESVNPIKLNPM